MLKISDRKWKEFKIVDVLNESINAKPYHSNNLKIVKESGIPYITRTSLNNGLHAIVKNNDYITNPKNTISFGAENAEYFYQPYRYITGNKMYYYQKDKLNYYNGLFIVSCLNKSIKDCGFGYGMGLTGTRSDKRKFELPVDKKGYPDYDFMEQFIKEREEKKRNEYIEYAKMKLNEIKSTIRETNGGGVAKTSYEAFAIKDVFTECERGKRLVKEKQVIGNIPYISSTALNNGVDSFIGNTEDIRIFKNCLSLANSGSVGSCFYEPFEFVASDHITHLKNERFNGYHYLFIATILNRLKEKYNFNREISDKRIGKEKVILPQKSNNIDYDFCESNIKSKIVQKYDGYISYCKDKYRVGLA